MPSKNRRQVAKKAGEDNFRRVNGEVSDDALSRAIAAPHGDRTCKVEVPASEFFAGLDQMVSKRIGPCHPRMHRTINFHSDPERGVMQLIVLDSATVPDISKKPS